MIDTLDDTALRRAEAERDALQKQLLYIIRELSVGDDNRPVEALVRHVKEERDALKLELLKLRQDIARHSAGMLRLVWTPEKIVEWANRRDVV